MKKLILLLTVVLICATAFSYTLGIQAKYVNVNLSGFYRAMQVTYIYPNSVASRFLQTGDLIIAACYTAIYAPGIENNTVMNISGNYVYNLSEFRDFAISSEQYFMSVVSGIGSPAAVITFIVYRNGYFIEFILGY
ncbi:MAG TPA: hypothetical protein PK466_08240 [Thermotogota bacterium]|nr:hypothetical protein [Thermotogota bacterium]HPJ87822.1 hypothetical protein [Thermotogota bacterium]HPR96306.1 hypothetical protein [Thermotogota bacterium]